MTCSDRKSVPTLASLRASKLTSGTTERRCREWIELLEASPNSTPAGLLYGGEAWTVLRSIEPGPGWTVDLWVLSAGYGLVPATAQLAAYSATFSPGKDDTVMGDGRTRQAAAIWWDTLAKWSGPQPGQPRSITELADSDPRTPIVVAGSRTYVRAIEADLRRATADHSSLFLITAGTAKIEGVHQVPTDARLSTTLAGSRTSLNARAVKFLLEGAHRHRFEQASLDAEFNALLDRGCVKSFDRRPMTDDEVRDFIKSTLGEALTCREQVPSKTALLRQLRDSGSACEQRRFGLLYTAVSESLKYDGLGVR